MSLGNNIRQMREQKGMTCVELGNAVGASETFISYVERDKRVPGVRMLVDMAEIFDCSLDRLVHGGTEGR